MTSVSFRALLGLAALVLPLQTDAAQPAGEFTVLFVGGAAGDEGSPTLSLLEARLRSVDPKHGVVVFTGNYGAGELPPEGVAGRADAERDLLAHVLAARPFVERGGRVYFLAGARDFAEGGSAAVQRLRNFLNLAFEPALGAGTGGERKKLDVMPQAGCGEPVVLELTGNLGLMLLNSQWWMEDWDADPRSNQGCQLKTRDGLRAPVHEAFNGHRTRRLIVASHHPLRSYGQFGGAFPASAHLRPVPIVGSLQILARQAGLVPQYQHHPRVDAYVGMLLEEAQRFGSFLFASGHDGSLQYLQVEDQTQLISGSSARSAEPVTPARPGEFAAATPGWAEVTIGDLGGGAVRFVSGQTVVFQAAVPALAPLGVALPGLAPPLPPGPVIATWAKGTGKRLGAVAKFFAGSFYSDAYRLELPYPVLDLQTEEGGLTPQEAGGGLQTNTLRLTDPRGGEWSLRPITKDSRRLLAGSGSAPRPPGHFFTTMHPEAALAVPRLAKAIGVLHTEPRLMYLPDQDALGKFRGYLGDEVVLLERRANEPSEGALPTSLAGEPGPAGRTRFRSAAETIEKVTEDPQQHRVDQEAMLRARLLDLFIGDWDRHEGQWRFAELPQLDGTRVYQPIPRDRDQAFGNFDAFMLQVAQTGSPSIRQLRPFDASYGNLVWLARSGRNFDPILLNRLSRERWMAIATQAKRALTDEVIDEALASWHPEAYRLDGVRISADLKARRDTLDAVALEYFDLVNRNAEVLGSRRDDVFELWFEAGGGVRVSVGARGEGGAEPAAWFDRRYEPGHTSELRIYALEGDDLLRVHGRGHEAIAIRFVGGEGDDVVIAARGAGREAPAIRLYDTEHGARIDPSIAIRDERSSLPSLNQYDRTENHEPSTATLIPGLRANPDDGANLGADGAYFVQGFKQSPFAARHLLSARFLTATLGATLDYRGLLRQSAAGLDQDVELSLKAPTHTRNFFGYTNALVDGGEPLDYYRVRQAWAEARYGLSFADDGDRTRVGAQLLGQAIVTEPTPGRFVTQAPEVGRDALGPRYFVGARLFAQHHTFDSLTQPTHGVGARLSVEGRGDPVKGAQFSTTYKVVAAAAIPFDRKHRLVLQTRVSLEGIVGEHPFYFAPTLGDTELRAYHGQQLAGEVAFAQTTDLRIEVLHLAGVIGVNLSVDHGRVFGPSIAGDTYHLNLGGSVWWSVMDTMGLSLGYYRGLDGGSSVRLAFGPMFAPAAL